MTDCGLGQGLVSVEKGVPFGFPLWDLRERRCKPHREAQGRYKARGQGVQVVPTGARKLRGHRCCEKKMWVPWNGLIVIGKRMELQCRNTQKPRMWDPKPNSEYWGLEDVEKTVLKEKSGLSQERVNVELLHRVASALQASAGVGKESPKQVWGKQEVIRKTRVEFGSTGTGVWV